MTAIFAFAESTTVFVATDTKRAFLQGAAYPTVADKTHLWSPSVLIAQTGYGAGLQRLLGEMHALQDQKPDYASAQGAAEVFERVRRFRLEYEIYHHASNARAKVAGTLVVIGTANVKGGAAQILTLKWESGAVTPCKSTVYADGSDPPAFQLIADEEYARLRPGGIGPLDLGEWAKACIDRAIAHQGADNPAVGWPIDLTMCTLKQSSSFACVSGFGKGRRPAPSSKFLEGFGNHLERRVDWRQTSVRGEPKLTAAIEKRHAAAEGPRWARSGSRSLSRRTSASGQSRRFEGAVSPSADRQRGDLPDGDWLFRKVPEADLGQSWFGRRLHPGRWR